MSRVIRRPRPALVRAPDDEITDAGAGIACEGPASSNHYLPGTGSGSASVSVVRAANLRLGDPSLPLIRSGAVEARGQRRPFDGRF
jgi:hypothetical protein